MRVKQKTLRGTISRSEFDSVRNGMTRARLREVVGFKGRDCHFFDGETICVYDMMPFWRWSIIYFRDGRVSNKLWDVGHD